MNQVDSLHVGRYWSKVLHCIIMTHLSDPEVKVTNFEILCLSFCLKCLNSILLEHMDGSS